MTQSGFRDRVDLARKPLREAACSIAGVPELEGIDSWNDGEEGSVSPFEADEGLLAEVS
jgi:hypothetical protein